MEVWKGGRVEGPLRRAPQPTGVASLEPEASYSWVSLGSTQPTGYTSLLMSSQRNVLPSATSFFAASKSAANSGSSSNSFVASHSSASSEIIAVGVGNSFGSSSNAARYLTLAMIHPLEELISSV